MKNVLEKKLQQPDDQSAVLNNMECALARTRQEFEEKL
jgi:hypothetical protein